MLKRWNWKWELDAHLVRNVRHGIRGFDVMQDPSTSTFRYQFPAENLSKNKGKAKWQKDVSFNMNLRRVNLQDRNNNSPDLPRGTCWLWRCPLLHRAMKGRQRGDGFLLWAMTFNEAKSQWTCHLLSQEILLQRPFTRDIVLERDVTICAESSGEHGDVTKDRLPGKWVGFKSWLWWDEVRKKINPWKRVRENLQRFVKNVWHLVLKILSSNYKEMKNQLAYTQQNIVENTTPKGLIKFCPYFPFNATISPHAPPTFELISNAFQRW